MEFEENRNEYAEKYDEEEFNRKVEKGGFGRAFLERLYTLFEVLKDPDTPAWVKVGIMAVLAYFVCPIDVIPDVLPVVGYSDDLAVIAAELAAITSYITPSIQDRVRRRLA